MVSAGCVLWLQQLQPVWPLSRCAALSYQAWLVWRRPAFLRTRAMLLILWGSIGSSSLVALVWVGLWFAIDECAFTGRCSRGRAADCGQRLRAAGRVAAPGGRQAGRRARPRHHLTDVRSGHGRGPATTPGRRCQHLDQPEPADGGSRLRCEAHAFSTVAFREAVGEAEVEVLRFEVDVCGVVVHDGDQWWLTSGTDRFLLSDGEWAGGQRVCVTGRLADGSDRLSPGDRGRPGDSITDCAPKRAMVRSSALRLRWL